MLGSPSCAEPPRSSWSSCSRSSPRGAAARATSASDTTATAAAASCDKGSLNLVHSGQLTVGTDNPAFPPWFGGDREGRPGRSATRLRPGLRERRRLRGREQARLRQARGQVGRRAVQHVVRARAEEVRLRHQPDLVHAGSARRAVDFSDSYYDVNQALVVVKGTPIATRDTRSPASKPYKLGAQLGTTSYDYIVNNIKPSQQPAVFDTQRRRGRRAEEQADRRARRRPPDRVLRHGRRRCRTARSSASSRRTARRRALRHGLRRRATRSSGASTGALTTLREERRAEAHPADSGWRRRRRAGPEVAADGRAPLADPRRVGGGDGARRRDRGRSARSSSSAASPC